MINNIVIVEDERLNADRIKRLLASILPDATIQTVLESVSQSVSWFREHAMPDLILMDIRLSDGLSFDIFKDVSITCPVIFTTAYDEYAVQAFKYNGIDYLLKPVEAEELQEALKRIDQSKYKMPDTFVIENLIDQLRPKDYRRRFLLPFKDGYKAIIVDEISYISVEYGITSAHMADGCSAVLLQNMEDLEQQLDPRKFFRANRQYILNIDSIAEVQNHFNGKLVVYLKNGGDKVLVSRNKAIALKSWLDS